MIGMLGLEVCMGGGSGGGGGGQRDRDVQRYPSGWVEGVVGCWISAFGRLGGGGGYCSGW